LKETRRLTGLVGLTKGEAGSNFESDVEDEVTNHLDVVTRHDHFLSSILNTLGPCKSNSDISSTDEALRPVVLHEGSVTAAFFLGQDL
jgi:hypothetical protein